MESKTGHSDGRRRKTLSGMLAALMLLAAPASYLRAQEKDVYRMEIGGGAGICFGLTDVNSRLYGKSSLAGTAMLRFLLNPRMTVKTTLSCGRLKGSAASVEDFYPAQPGLAGTERLKFDADAGIYDLCALYELHFLPYGYEQGYQGFRRLVPYLQLGIGITYSDAGKAVAPNFPVGLGLKYKVAARLNVGLDWRMHFTPSDKLEGLPAPLGIKSAGFRNKDHYATTLLTLTYDISPRCPTCNKD